MELKSAEKGCTQKLYDRLFSFFNRDDGGTIIFGIDEKQNYKEVGVYDPQDIQKKINEQCLQMEPIVRPVMTVVDQSALEHYMTLYLEFKFVVRHMKNRIVYDTKCCVITNVRLYLKNCGGCQCGTPGELIYRN